MDGDLYTDILEEDDICMSVDDVDTKYVVSCNALDNKCMSQDCRDVFTTHEVNIIDTLIFT